MEEGEASGPAVLASLTGDTIHQLTKAAAIGHADEGRLDALRIVVSEGATFRYPPYMPAKRGGLSSKSSHQEALLHIAETADGAAMIEIGLA